LGVLAVGVGAVRPARREAAAASADLIGSTARTAMSELRRLLGVLRFTDYGHAEQARLTPVPSLARLDELLDVVREAGLRVTCRVSGPAATLPPGVDLTAYRILQEALTNALRHAPGSAASVRLIYTETDLTVEATNTVPVPAAAAPVPQRVPGVVGVVGVPGFAADSAPLSAPADLAELSELSASAGPGYGLAGIAERVASCGGFLALGPAADGGFTVTARLPLT
jgi:signal transduction histidine kinase